MEDIKALFRENSNGFTIYVVEQKFVIGRGLDYFKSYKGKPNYIDTDSLAEKTIYKIYSWIEKKVPTLTEMINIAFGATSHVSLVETVIALNKLFGSQIHQAAGPEVIDPIIIQEGKVIKKYITKLVNLHKDSFLAPTVIILLKDNNFERAKELLCECPNGVNVKFIRNNGQCEIYKIVNTGAENIDHFINSFAEQCFSTCSNTKHDILLNREWSENSIVKLYSPRLLKYRANLLCDEKQEIKEYLNQYISELQNCAGLSENDEILKKDFLCMAKLYRVFTNDSGKEDMIDAYNLAQELNNPLLLAYVYKYAYFFENKNTEQETQMLETAYDTFMKYNMADNAIYCKNNMLVRQFDYGKIQPKQFTEMLGDAISDVPGLVGMSHIYNNAGLAYMMSAKPEQALELFDNGLTYADPIDRNVQYLAIQCNKLITKSYYGEHIEFSEIKNTLIQIYDGMVRNEQLPFISARYVMNLLILAIRENKNWGKQIFEEYDIIKLINSGLRSNKIGSGQLFLQLEFVEEKLPNYNIKKQCKLPDDIIQVTGRRKEFIKETGLNPFYFFTWL